MLQWSGRRLVVRCGALARFGMLLDVGRFVQNTGRMTFWMALFVLAVFLAALSRPVFSFSEHISGAAPGTTLAGQSPSQSSPQGSAAPAAQQAPPSQATPPPTSPTTPGAATQTPPTPPRAGLNIVVLDPAHGGTDLGARGTGGIHESDIVLEFAAQVRTALESQGFQVLQTRQANANPSFDDRSAMANAQRGAIFVTLHIASTGTPGTARVYVMNDMAPAADATGLIPWDRAQAPFVSLSRKLGDQVQSLLAQRFKGSPASAQTASVRQLRTTAAPAIAVEVSSVTVEDRAQLDHMAPGVADAIARGAAVFRPSYVVPTNPGERP